MKGEHETCLSEEGKLILELNLKKNCGERTSAFECESRVILIYTMMDAGSCQACQPAIIQTVNHLITSSKLDKRVRTFVLRDFCSLFIIEKFSFLFVI